MFWSDISWRPADRVLRQFAVLSLAFLALLAWRHGFPGKTGVVESTLGVLATVVALLGIVRPQTIRWPFLGLALLTLPVGWVVARLLLTVLWLGAMTPLGLCFRLLGRDALGLKYRAAAVSYWEARQPTAEARRYLQPF